MEEVREEINADEVNTEEVNSEKTNTEEANTENTNALKEKKGIRGSGLLKGIAIGVAGIIILECIAVRLIAGRTDKLNLLSIDLKAKEIEALIDRRYLYDADKQNMEDGMFMGMVYGLTEDRYSAYYSKEVYAEERKRLSGNYVGVGITISKDMSTGGIYIHAVNGDGPAARAGIMTGDIIIKADGIDLTQKDADYAVSIITGEEGTDVALTVLRDREELEFTVTRENITSVSVKSDYIDENQAIKTLDGDTKNTVKGTNIGYISISTFNQATLQEFIDELDYLTEDKQANGIVIDLRNNTGGDMNICLEMLDMILADDLEPVAVQQETSEEENDNSSDGTDTIDTAAEDEKNIIGLTADGLRTDSRGTLLLSVENKRGEALRYYASDKHSKKLPIVVVVNGSSASASEIFAGTLRDYGYQIVGTKTFGKGIVQSIYNLSDGSAVKFTTEQYRLAGGELIHGKGIEPTIEAEFEEYDGVTENSVNYASGSAQPELTKDKQIIAAVKEIERQVYEAYQQQ